MLILPLIKNKQIINYQMQLKDQEIIEPSEIHIGNIFTKLKEGEVYSNGKCYSTWFSDRMLPGSAIIDYIRNYSNSTADIDVFVSTKNRIVQDTHDIYKINLPATTSSELKNSLRMWHGIGNMMDK